MLLSRLFLHVLVHLVVFALVLLVIVLITTAAFGATLTNLGSLGLFGRLGGLDDVVYDNNRLGLHTHTTRYISWISFLFEPEMAKPEVCDWMNSKVEMEIHNGQRK